MKKIIDWLLKSHRWQHLLFGILIGFGATDAYCAAYAGVGVSITSELKDKLWVGLWDWIDFTLTLAGVAVGYTVRGLIFGFKLS